MAALCSQPCPRECVMRPPSSHRKLKKATATSLLSCNSALGTRKERLTVLVIPAIYVWLRNDGGALKTS